MLEENDSVPVSGMGDGFSHFVVVVSFRTMFGGAQCLPFIQYSGVTPEGTWGIQCSGGDRILISSCQAGALSAILLLWPE